MLQTAEGLSRRKSEFTPLHCVALNKGKDIFSALQE